MSEREVGQEVAAPTSWDKGERLRTHDHHSDTGNTKLQCCNAAITSSLETCGVLGYGMGVGMPKAFLTAKNAASKKKKDACVCPYPPAPPSRQPVNKKRPTETVENLTDVQRLSRPPYRGALP